MSVKVSSTGVVHGPRLAIASSGGAEGSTSPATSRPSATRAVRKASTSARTERIDGPLQITGIVIADGAPAVPANQPFTIALDLRTDVERRVRLHVGITEGPAAPVIALEREIVLKAGASRVLIELGGLPLGKGRYALWVGASGTRASDDLIPWHPETDLEVIGPEADPPPPGVSRVAPVQVGARWSVDHR